MKENFRKYFHIILPGLLVAATGVGAGDLITASLAGNYIGLSILWAPLLGAFMKFFLTEGMVRHQIATQNLLLESWSLKFSKLIQWVFLLYLIIWTYSVGGALINSCAAAIHALLPMKITESSSIFLGGLHSIIAVIFVLKGSFHFFEKLMSLLISLMFATVILGSFAFIDQPLTALAGLIPSIPEKNISWLIGLIGGVGGTLTILSYGYWINEEKRNNDEGLKICKIDLTVAYGLTALFSMAMVILGTHLNLDGVSKAQISSSLANLFASKFGYFGAVLFKLGFWAGVFSSLLGVWQSVPYLFTSFYEINFLPKNSVTHLHHKDKKKTKAYKFYLLFISVVPITSFWVKFEVIQLAYAFVGALFIPALALSLLILNNDKSLPKIYQNTWKSNLLLSLCLIFFVGIGLRNFL